MLTSMRVRPVGGPGRRRTVFRALLWPTVRVSGLDRVAGTALLGSVPLLVTLVRSRSELGMSSFLLAIVAGASVGWIADDPTHDLLTPCPVNSTQRLAYRVLAAVATVLGVIAAVMVAVAIGGRASPHWTERVPEASFAALVALAFGFAVVRRGDPLGGTTGVAIGMMLPAFVTAMAFRWPGQIPSFGSGPIHSRWWVLALVAAIAAGRGITDPATRLRFRRSTEDR